MQGNEDSLAAIPTERLVLTLLQELAIRVEKLETKVDVVEQQSRRWPSAQKLPSKDIPEKEGSTTTTSQADAEELPSHDDPIVIDDKSLLVPYGCLLDGEDPGNIVMRPRDRLDSISAVNPEIAELLRQLGGIVQGWRIPE